MSAALVTLSAVIKALNISICRNVSFIDHIRNE
jgi:hypothetical protein